ncbi:transporter substrate-binding domain-containing protein [Arenibacter palladensis]|uniref:transporter substrate-binding domain-containing protein n=1 Tax=Arenibacter palladensis TaxID=237373 RepID=UPI0026E15808|nr:transporter substrate-binding domain-containing protein [Arenibacter palladensis]MDO6601857.1 transporter substrate-binding domain-containing protein [Arenibacter palladensis]
MLKINFRINHRILVFVLLLLSACGPKLSSTNKYSNSNSANVSPILNTILGRDTINIGTTGDFMPFSYKTDASNNYLGIDIVMAKDLAKHLGVNFKFIETTWPTLMTDLMEGKFDVGMSGITITSAREKQALFSIPVYSSGKVAITRDENVSLYASIENINRKEVKVIFNPGGTNESFARENFPKATLILNEDNITIFQKLIDKEADVMVTDAIETRIQEQIHKELEAVNPNKPFNSFDFGYLIQKDSVFKRVIDEWLLVKKQDSIVEKLLQQEIAKLE